MTSSQLNLISFKLCPFVQRVSTALNWKKIDYGMVYVELSDPPEWFLELSPFKKVPLLQVGDQVIFESTAINEYLEDAYPNNLHPADRVLRARNRSWIQRSNELTWSAFRLSVEETESGYLEICNSLHTDFDELELAVQGPFFNGGEFALVDASFAPLLQRLAFLDELRPGALDPDRHPAIDAWKDTLLAQDAVSKSCVTEIRELYRELLAKRRGYISRFLDESRYGHVSQKSIY